MHTAHNTARLQIPTWAHTDCYRIYVNQTKMEIPTNNPEKWFRMNWFKEIFFGIELKFKLYIFEFRFAYSFLLLLLLPLPPTGVDKISMLLYIRNKMQKRNILLRTRVAQATNNLHRIFALRVVLAFAVEVKNSEAFSLAFGNCSFRCMFEFIFWKIDIKSSNNTDWFDLR